MGTHQAETALICSFLTWFFGSFLTAVFKPKTPEEYEAMGPRKAAFWKMMATIVTDFPKAMDAFLQFAKGKQDPRKAPK